MIYEKIVLRAERPMVNEAESFDEQTEIAYKFFVSMFELPEMFHPKYIPAYSKAGIREMDWNNLFMWRWWIQWKYIHNRFATKPVFMI